MAELLATMTCEEMHQWVAYYEIKAWEAEQAAQAAQAKRQAASAGRPRRR